MPVKMKKFFIFLNYFLICITPVFADQFGMLYGMFTSPTGETRLCSNGDEVALKSNKPTTGLFFWLRKFKGELFGIPDDGKPGGNHHTGKYVFGSSGACL